MLKCMNCGHEFEKEEDAIPVYSPDGEIVGHVCEECIGDGYDYCNETGKVFATEDLVWIEDREIYVNRQFAVDSSKYDQCDDCGNWFSWDYMYHDSQHDICERCYDRNDWYTCERCGDLIPSGSEYWHDEEVYCEDCYQYVNENACFHDYFYKPNPRFKSMPGEVTKLYYGVELETDNGSCRSEYCDDLYGIGEHEEFFYLKEDGSLHNGVEIVTQPCSLDYHLSEFPWEKIREVARNYGYKSHDTTTCGLHVHVSRNALGDTDTEQDLTIAKIILLVDRFWETLVKFSRRNYRSLDQWAQKPDACIEKGDDADTVISKSKRGSYTRYRAVNLTNLSTIEFRLFRGSLKVNTIKATLELLDNLVHFSKEKSLEDVQDSTWEDIVNYRRYDELQTYLTERGMLSAPQVVAYDDENESEEE